MPKLNRRFAPMSREVRLAHHARAACEARMELSRAAATGDPLFHAMYMRGARMHACYARQWLAMYYEIVDREARWAEADQ